MTDGLEVTVIGSGTIASRLGRRQSCVAVRSGDETVVLDLGAGAVRGMMHAGLDPLALDRIFFTHFHPDHTSDVVPLMFAMQYGSDEPRSRPLHLTGPRPFLGFWNSIFSAWGEWMVGDHALSVSELPLECPVALDVAGFSVTWGAVKHRPESIGYRLEHDGRVFVYTGDTEYAPSVVELARDAHTVLIECSFPDDAPVPGHLTPSGVARIASEAGVERIVLTHIYPAAEGRDLVSEVQRGYGGEVILAHDGMKLDV
jgi:ribonuclease BN (tRNA processing enzyme)